MAEPGDWDHSFRLTAEIDMTGVIGQPMGRPSDGPFRGEFHGDGRSVRGWHAESVADGYLGLFGWVEGSGARIRELTLVEPNVASEFGRYVAPLVGYLEGGSVVDCHVLDGRAAGFNFVGGLVGRSEDGTITDCTVRIVAGGVARIGGRVGENCLGLVSRCCASGEVVGLPGADSWNVGGLVGENDHAAVVDSGAICTVRGDAYVGGLVGDNAVGEVSRCRAGGTVFGVADVGGLVGRTRGGTIIDCYALAAVTGDFITGGLLGRNAPSCYCTGGTPGLVSCCWAAGPVGTRTGIPAGGLLSRNEACEVLDSFWDVDATGCPASEGGAPRTTSALQDAGTYQRAGWSIAGGIVDGSGPTWVMPESPGYPILSWERVVETADGSTTPAY
jgi:hypothetical protein